MAVRNLLIIVLSGSEKTRVLIWLHLIRIHGGGLMSLCGWLVPDRLLLGILGNFGQRDLMLIHHLESVATRARAPSAVYWSQHAAQRLRTNLKVLDIRLLIGTSLNVDEIGCILRRSNSLPLFLGFRVQTGLVADTLFVTLDNLSVVRVTQLALPANQVVTEHILLLEVLIQVFLEFTHLRLLLLLEIKSVLFAVV